MSFPVRLIVVSNRLPVSVSKHGSSHELEPSSGGLVTALTPVLRETGGCWIGWPGTEYDEEVERKIRHTSLPGGVRLIPVFLTEEERKNFYCGFANEVIWPLFHDLQTCCNFEPEYWETYRKVNEKFADSLASVATRDDFVWVHDYHLMLLASVTNRESLPRMGYFHHIPFPPPDIFEKLPWRAAIIRGLLKFEVIGFQTIRDQRNFVSCVRRFMPAARFRRNGTNLFVTNGARTAVLGTFPISVDFADFAETAGAEDVAARSTEIKHCIPGTVILGVDRLDYTKGIPERLKAFRLLLKTHCELHGKVSLVQIVVPSREDVPKYRELRLNIEQLVSQINGAFGRPGWLPVHFLHRQVPRKELLAYYRAADVAVVTSLKDGMNLVAKEYCAAQVNEDGALILSEFAGAAAELGDGALLVNPYDTEGVMQSMLRACNMRPEERRSRMRRMREVVRNQTVFDWCKQFYRAARVRVNELPVPRMSRFPKLVPFVAPVASCKRAAGFLA